MGMPDFHTATGADSRFKVILEPAGEVILDFLSTAEFANKIAYKMNLSHWSVRPMNRVETETEAPNV